MLLCKKSLVDFGKGYVFLISMSVFPIEGKQQLKEVNSVRIVHWRVVHPDIG